MNIQELSDVELKAFAYDALACMEKDQKKLQIVNQELQRRAQLSVSNDLEGKDKPEDLKVKVEVKKNKHE
jgi:hypothetical protein